MMQEYHCSCQNECFWVKGGLIKDLWFNQNESKNIIGSNAGIKYQKKYQSDLKLQNS